MADGDPVIGDGVLDLSDADTNPNGNEEDTTMTTDISPNFAVAMVAESATNMQAGNRNVNGVFNAVMGAIAGTVQTNFAEVGVLEGRAVSGVNATPLAGPVNSQQG